MPQVSGKLISCARRTSQGIGETAGADRSGPTGQIALPRGNAGHSAVFGDDLLGRSAHHPHARLFAERRHEIRHVVCIVGAGKYPVSPLGLERQAMTFKERYGICRRQPVQSAVQKAPVPGDIGHKGLDIAVVVDVAAALARDAQLFAELVVRLQQHNGQAALRRGIGTHHPGGTAADDNEIYIAQVHLCSLLL